MSSEFGNKIKISVFGQSHGESIGVVINGLPSGEAIDFNELQTFMERRRGGKNAFSTKRSEADIPEFVSGIANGKTCGMPLCAIIRNGDKRSSDYSELLDKPRPGHADYTAFVKWSGNADMRGGGHFSGRLTAPLCIAGGIAKQILARRGIYVGAHLDSVAGIRDKRFEMTDGRELFEEIATKDFPVIDTVAGEQMKAAIISASGELDSVGGVIECMVTGMPAGIGEPMFDGVENRLASALFGIPAVKGVEFGRGFETALLKGSENNDPYIIENGEIKTATNNAGGILGGITNGAPVVVRTAIKPTPSISREQDTVSLSEMTAQKLVVKGRHDPCIAQRAVPVVEAVTAAVLLDMLIGG
ncbi:MAG: chorismate synthase [Ruminococcaceae bacterium]|nr:chorismate synthase [Oscillospiraceae bacterium]